MCLLAHGSSLQFIQQCLCFLQVARIEPFSEPVINWRQQFARLLHLALVAPEALRGSCRRGVPRILFAAYVKRRALARNTLALSQCPASATALLFHQPSD